MHWTHFLHFPNGHAAHTALLATGHRVASMFQSSDVCHDMHPNVATRDCKTSAKHYIMVRRRLGAAADGIKASPDCLGRFLRVVALLTAHCMARPSSPHRATRLYAMSSLRRLEAPSYTLIFLAIARSFAVDPKLRGSRPRLRLYILCYFRVVIVHSTLPPSADDLRAAASFPMLTELY